MLFLVGAWLVLLAASVPTGAAILRWTTAQRVFDRTGDRAVLSAWLGTLVLGIGLLAVSLLFPISPITGAVVGLGAAAVALSWRAVRDEIEAYRARFSRRLMAAFLAFIVGIALLTAQPVVWFDTGLYHASAIRWLSEFGAVEGIALVHDRLGFASSWFALAAPFNPGGLRDHAVVVMGGFALLLLVFHVLICVARALRRTARLSDWLLIAGSALLIASLAGIQNAQVSASPDVPVAILGLLVGWSIFTLANAPRAEASAVPPLSPGPASLPLLLALGAMTVKPQAAPLAVVAALFYASFAEPKLSRLLWIIGLGLVLLVPWIAYEVTTTGCPAYPLPVCTDVEWSVGGDTAREVSETVQSRARWHAEPPGSGLGWVGPWLTDNLNARLGAVALLSFLALCGGLVVGVRTAATSRLHGWATWATIVGALAAFLLLVRVEEIFMLLLAATSLVPLAERRPGAGWLLALGLSGIAFTLYAAPDPRFALGYMAVLLARLAIFQGSAIWRRLSPDFTRLGPIPKIGIATLLVAAAAAAALAPLVRPTTPTSPGPSLGLPAETPVSVTVSPANDIQYRVPTLPDGLCWAAELPCTPAYELSPDVELQDADRGIDGGFARSSATE